MEKETTKTANETNATIPKIYAAIVGVMQDVGAVGKNDKNKQQGFMYRGIDAVMNALQPAMIKNKLFVVPTVLSEERTERKTDKGSVLFYTRLKINYTFYAEDGSRISAEVIGEAMDSGDKATNKAMSIAYKYACFQVFCIPTEEMHDPDGESHDVAPTEPEVFYVDDVKIKVLKDNMKKKGVTDNQVLEICKVSTFEEITVQQFMSVMKKLEKTPDVESKQVDLGL
jgi:hypothetical protein